MKYFGSIGYAVSGPVAGRPGVISNTIVERPYFGDVVKSIRNLKSGEGVNSDIEVNNQISIVSDPFAVNNINNIRYATYNGAKWTVKSVEIQYPRLILVLGGVYNGG